MKKTIIAIIFSVALGGILFSQNEKAAATQDKQDNKAAAHFQKVLHDFGAIKEDGKVTCTFEFTNKGKAPLIINRVSTTCGCTTPSYTQEPILPGKKGKIDVGYNTVARPGTFNKNITVYTNVPDTVYVLTIKGNVIPKK